MEPSTKQFTLQSPEEVTNEIKARSAAYVAAQPKEVNQGFLHSGVNQLTYNSYTGINKKPVAVGNKLEGYKG